MIKQKYENLVFAFFMSLIMSGIMSLVITIFNTGITDHGLVNNIIAIWLQAWLFSFLIALPTILAISPVIAWLVKLVIRPNIATINIKLKDGVKS
jgi:hypothetical protein